MILLQTNCEGFWAWPWPLIFAFLLGVLLGWILKSIFEKNSDNNDSNFKAELDASNKNHAKLQADLDACRANLKTTEAKFATIAADTQKANANSLAFAVAKKDDSVKDDLTKIEGIGPKIKGLLNDDGIWSFMQLSKVETARLQRILDDAGSRYRMHNPKTWAKQADYAAKGEWKALSKWQDELNGGL